MLFESSMLTRLGKFNVAEPLAGQVELLSVLSHSSVVELPLNMRKVLHSIPSQRFCLQF